MQPLAWEQEAPGSNPGAPTTNSLNYLRLFLRGISTTIRLGNITPEQRSQIARKAAKSRWAKAKEKNKKLGSSENR
jgi:hypothetical protein